MSRQYFDAIAPSLIVRLEKALDQFSSETELKNYQNLLSASEEEAVVRHEKYKNNLEIHKSFSNLLALLRGECALTLERVLDMEDLLMRDNTSTEMVAMWCVGLEPFRLGKPHYNQGMTVKWFLEEVPGLGKTDLDRFISTFNAFNESREFGGIANLFQQNHISHLARLDGLSPMGSIVLASRFFEDEDNALFKLIYTEDGFFSDYSVELSESILDSLIVLSQSAAAVYRVWIENNGPFEDRCLYNKFGSEKLAHWMLESCGTIPPMMQWHLDARKPISMLQESEENPEKSLEVDEQVSSTKELDELPKLKIPERRLLVLKGWLIGSGYRLNDVVDETREHVWNELKKADPKLFKADAISYKSGEKKLASTPEKFFKNDQEICSFR